MRDATESINSIGYGMFAVIEVIFSNRNDMELILYIWTKGEVVTPLNRFNPSSKIFYLPFQGDDSFVDHLCYFCLVLLCFHVRLFVLWSSAGKWLTSWLSFVMS